MSGVVIVWALALWGFWSCWLLGQYMHAPAAITRVGAVLLVAELLTLAVHSFGCTDDDCSVAGAAAGSAASVDVPVLGLVLLALGVGREWRRAHRVAQGGRTS